MYTFGKTSLARLETCHIDIQMIMRRLILILDFSVLCGHRGEEEQNKAVVEGRSKVSYPNSRHNGLPSMAIDIAPYPIDWDDTNRFYWLAGIAVGISHVLYEEGLITHKLRYGGDWDKDGDITDQSFNDLPHLELYIPEE